MLSCVCSFVHLVCRIKAGADYIKEKAKETLSTGEKEVEKEKAKGNV